MLFLQVSTIIVLQYTHLIDDNLIEAHKAVALWHALINENGIDILHVGKANQFIDRGIVADVSFQF